METVTSRSRNQAKGKNRANARQRGRAKQATGGSEGREVGPDSKLTLWKPPSKKSGVVVRVFRIPGTASSTAGGALTLVATGCAALITALGTEFTNFAQEFQEYRVKALETTFFPATTSATSVTGPYQVGVLCTPWWQFVPATLVTMEQSVQMKEWSSLYMEKVMVKGFANSDLWTPTTAAIVADRDFGIAYQSVGTFAASSLVFVTLGKLTVEFRQAQ